MKLTFQCFLILHWFQEGCPNHPFKTQEDKIVSQYTIEENIGKRKTNRLLQTLGHPSFDASKVTHRSVADRDACMEDLPGTVSDFPPQRNRRLEDVFKTSVSLETSWFIFLQISPIPVLPGVLHS